MEKVPTLDELLEKFHHAWKDLPACIPELLEAGLDVLRNEGHPFRTVSRLIQHTGKKESDAILATLLTATIETHPRTFRDAFVRRWVTRHHSEMMYFPDTPGQGHYFVKAALKMFAPEDLVEELQKYLRLENAAVAADAIDALFWLEIELRKRGEWEIVTETFDTIKTELAEDFLHSPDEIRLEALALVVGDKWIPNPDMRKAIQERDFPFQEGVEDLLARREFLFPVRGMGEKLNWEAFAAANQVGFTIASEAGARLILASESEWREIQQMLEGEAYGEFLVASLTECPELPETLLPALFLRIMKNVGNAKYAIRNLLRTFTPVQLLEVLVELSEKFPETRKDVQFMAYYIRGGMEVGNGNLKLRIPDFERYQELKSRI